MAIAAALWLPLVFLGFGADNDTYSALDTGNRLLFGSHKYLPSRSPGYPAHEVIVALTGAGGYVLANLATMALALVALGSVLRISQLGGVPHRRILALILAIVPYVWINATSSIDYFWAMGIALAGVLFLLRGSVPATLAAGCMFGLAVGFRLTTGLLILGLLYFAWAMTRRIGPILVAAAATATLGVLFYVPSFLLAGRTLAFLSPNVGPDAMWTPTMRVGRFAFKNLQLWGLPAALLLIGILVVGLPPMLRRLPGPQRPIVITSLGVVIAYQAMFLRYPIEIAYLLPSVPFLLILVAVIVAKRPAVLVALGVLVVIGCFVSVQLAAPDVPGRATSARPELAIRPGPLITNTQQRLLVRDCRTLACWNSRFGGGG
jgi:hypothetical protein